MPGKHKDALKFPENYNVNNHYGKPHMSHPDMYTPEDGHSPEDGHNMPESNKFIGKLTEARKAGKKTFEVNGKEYKVRTSGGGPNPNKIGYAEKYSASNFNDKAMKMMGQAPLYKHK
jgi:hypothetical protein